MLKATMRYGAIRAKVMAMQGKLLSEDDFAHLCECKSFSDIVSYLRGHKGWGEIISGLPAPVTAEGLVQAISDCVWTDSEKLYRFCDFEDKSFLRFFICWGEYKFILSTLRRLGSEEKDKKLSTKELPLIFSKFKKSLNISALVACSNWEELLSAVSESIFETKLRGLNVDPDTHLPNYREVSVLLENAYYRELFSYISKKYRGFGKIQLQELLGREADLLNIISLLRLQRYFPGSLEKAQSLLIPIHYRLRPVLIEGIICARNETEALELLKKTKYRQNFSDIKGDRLESIYERAMTDFCRRLIRVTEPSTSMVLAYLAVREIECKKLLRVIEAEQYGVNPKKAI